MPLKIFTIILFCLMLTASISFAATGSTTVETYVNPCSIFLTETSCLSAGCYWWSGLCHDSQQPSEGQGQAKTNFSIKVNILTEKITTPGNLSFIINITNEEFTSIDGVLNYWIENPLAEKKYYEHLNETMRLVADSSIGLDRSIFLLLPEGDYQLKVEFQRTPIETQEVAEDKVDFSVVSYLGWYSSRTGVSWTEIAMISCFLLLIVILGYGIIKSYFIKETER